MALRDDPGKSGSPISRGSMEAKPQGLANLDKGIAKKNL